ncbi:hypothetical protein [Granulicoccus phenolivorans]|uniref:P-type ATPase n=1 Tax=Granulicoccus phenolivorans TaxID=266854 RepID=UPI00041B8355|nr:hypothetical protein [Granulicoccus phenolivorans]
MPGLTAAEAAARLAAGDGNTTELKQQVERPRLRSIFTIFQLNLLGLVGIQLLLGAPIGALITLVLALVSIGIRVGKEEYAQRRVDLLEQRMRPRATVIRDNRESNIDADRIVLGDLVVIGPGDQLQVDGPVLAGGPLVIDSSAVTGERAPHRAQPGDLLLAGSTCLAGRGTMRAERVGAHRSTHARGARRPAPTRQPTPLEHLVARILFVLLLVVVGYVAILLAKFFRLDVGTPGDALVDAAPVVFSLLPTGLYLMIIHTYTTGTAELARSGALVRSARSVESLAESNVVCFTDVGMLAGTAAEIVPVPGHDNDPDWPSSSQQRRLVGDLARNLPEPTPLATMIADAFDGVSRPVRFSAGALLRDGWTALAYAGESDPDLYVLARRSVLEPLLSDAEAARIADDSPDPAGVAAADRLVLAVARAAAGDPDWSARLTGPDGTPTLPTGLLPICAVEIRRRIHPDALEVIADWVATGVRIKVFAAGEPDQVLATLREAGLSPAAEADLLAEGGLSRAAYEALPPEQRAEAVARHRLFGGFRPDQVAEVVRTLRKAGRHVTVVGDGLTDLPALQQADLAVTQPASTQAALGAADIVLLSDSPAALLTVQRKGQAMVRGLLDILKLNLTLVVCSALLILAVRLLDIGFPYRSGQGTVISLLAVTIPSILLPLWTPPGAVDRDRHLRDLTRFVLPTGVSLALVATVVYLLGYRWSGDRSVAQSAVMYTLLYCGLLLSVLIHPPHRAGVRAQWRPVIMTVALAVLGTLLPLSVTARFFWSVQFLPGPAEYLLVAVAVVGWLGLVLGLGRLLRLPGLSGAAVRRWRRRQPARGRTRPAG